MKKIKERILFMGGDFSWIISEIMSRINSRTTGRSAIISKICRMEIKSRSRSRKTESCGTISRTFMNS